LLSIVLLISQYDNLKILLSLAVLICYYF